MKTRGVTTVNEKWEVRDAELKDWEAIILAILRHRKAPTSQHALEIILQVLKLDLEDDPDYNTFDTRDALSRLERRGAIVRSHVEGITLARDPAIADPNTQLWVVGKQEADGSSSWDFQGIFDDEARAVEACRTPSYFVGPATLNVPLPEVSVEWPGMYYPIKS